MLIFKSYYFLFDAEMVHDYVKWNRKEIDKVKQDKIKICHFIHIKLSEERLRLFVKILFCQRN
jgi:hypothetical protein